MKSEDVTLPPSLVDAEACVAMVARFKADAATPNFAGLLVDSDHFPLDEGEGQG